MDQVIAALPRTDSKDPVDLDRQLKDLQIPLYDTSLESIVLVEKPSSNSSASGFSASETTTENGADSDIPDLVAERAGEDDETFDNRDGSYSIKKEGGTEDMRISPGEVLEKPVKLLEAMLGEAGLGAAAEPLGHNRRDGEEEVQLDDAPQAAEPPTNSQTSVPVNPAEKVLLDDPSYGLRKENPDTVPSAPLSVPLPSVPAFATVNEPTDRTVEDELQGDLLSAKTHVVIPPVPLPSSVTTTEAPDETIEDEFCADIQSSKTHVVVPPVPTPKVSDLGIVEEIWNSVFTPGVNTRVQGAMNLSFLGLFLSLTMLAVVTGGNPHVIALIAIAACLFGSVQWFLKEMANMPPPPEATQVASSSAAAPLPHVKAE
ncbi:SMK killer toxin resistance protein [Thoreauomyces humboldtii]|nr:SMK killer toxin resistance protein [Thoreauomyces humboldtii]